MAQGAVGPMVVEVAVASVQLHVGQGVVGQNVAGHEAVVQRRVVQRVVARIHVDHQTAPAR